MNPKNNEEAPKTRFFSSLFRSNSLLEKIKSKKVHITGTFVLFLFCFLMSSTILPVFLIHLFKTFLWKKEFVGAIYYSLVQCALIVLCFPFFKWWGQSLLIFRSLKKKESKLQEKTQKQEYLAPTFSTVLFARALGLLPLVVFLPIKVLALPPQDLLHHILFPPISSAVLTGLDWTVRFFDFPSFQYFFGKKNVSFFLLNQASTYTRPSFVLSAVFLVLTYFLTIRKIQKISTLPFLYIASRVFVAVVVWDVLIFIGLFFLPLVA